MTNPVHIPVKECVLSNSEILTRPVADLLPLNYLRSSRNFLVYRMQCVQIPLLQVLQGQQYDQ